MPVLIETPPHSGECYGTRKAGSGACDGDGRRGAGELRRVGVCAVRSCGAGACLKHLDKPWPSNKTRTLSRCDTLPEIQASEERRSIMNLGLFVLCLMAPILGYGAYMSSRGRKHDRQRRHRRMAR
jgi:hypothetical protein